ILNRTNDRFVVRLPREGVIPGRVYPLMLVEIVTLRRIQDAVLRVRVCPIIGTRVTDSGNEREILIFADQIRKPAILQELRNRNIELLGNTDLDALGSVLIRARSDTPERAINDLRVALPDSEIDLNNDLSANDGPRLYMKKKISWPENDSCLTGAVTLSIGVIDGEVDQGHPAFKGQRIFSKNFLRGQSPDKQHATAIASILIGNAPELGLDGLLPGADLYSAIVLRQASGGNRLAHVGAIVEGLNWLLSKKLRLINMSLASDVRNNVLVAAVEKSLARGAIIFAAAGNQGPRAPSSYPAVIDGVIAVTAIDAAEYIYDAANQGDYIDFSAPGVDIWAAVLEGGGYVTGTSFAAPIALAVAALLQQKNPSISREVILRALSFNSRDLGATGKDQIFGEGLLQGNC
ncbi:MAG: S8 family serine peptidase, partial [Sneathiella sp.]